MKARTEYITMWNPKHEQLADEHRRDMMRQADNRRRKQRKQQPDEQTD